MQDEILYIAQCNEHDYHNPIYISRSLNKKLFNNDSFLKALKDQNKLSNCEIYCIIRDVLYNGDTMHL